MTRSIDEARAILGVASDSSPTALARAYRRLARVTHPDVSPSPDAAQRFAAVCAAYRLLRATTSPTPPTISAPSAASPSERRRAAADAGQIPVHRDVAVRVSTTPGLRNGGYAVPTQPPIVAGPTIVRPSPSDAASPAPRFSGHW